MRRPNLRARVDGVKIKGDGLFFDENTGHEIAAIYRKYFQDDINKEREIAESICSHEFTFLGHSFKHGKEVDWMLDPVSGKVWDSGFSQDIIFKGPDRLGDIKLVWELNKHQYLFVLGKLYWLTGKESLADEIIAQIGSWIERNPPYRGPNWISALEVGMRVISWIMVHPFIKKKMNETFCLQFIHSLYEQLRFIEQNLSYSRFANTHLIGEAASLVVGGFFLDSPRSNKWLSTGIGILSQEIQNQVFDDGVHKEQSLNYQRFFLDYYYLVMILLKKHKMGYPSHVDSVVEKMTEFVANALMPDGRAPSFGDADDARGIYIKESCIHDYKGILSLGAVLFNRRDFRYIAGDITEEILWLLGKGGVEIYLQLEAVPPEKTSIAFEKGGYYIMRSKWDRNADYLIFDCGPLGHGPAGHGHADALSFQLHSKEFTYLVDPGTYSYNIDYGRRDFFRSTRAHNTVAVDDLNQSEVADRMSWKTFANARANLFLSTEWFDFVDGEHDGYKRLKDPVSHRRIIFFDRKNYWVIFDFNKCEKMHDFDYYLQLHPDCSLEINPVRNRLMVISDKGKRLSIEFTDGSSEASDIKVLNGDKEDNLGWYSENYGKIKATNVIKVRKRSKGDIPFVTFINASLKDYRIDFKNDDALTCSVYNEQSGNEDTIFYALNPERSIAADSFSFKGKLCYAQRRCDETTLIYVKDFTSFKTGDVRIFSERDIQCLTVVKNDYEMIVADEFVNGLKIYGDGINKLVINGKNIERNEESVWR